jgi:hypothetical protein
MNAEALVDALIKIESTFCEKGQELREQKFSAAVPDIGDLEALGKEVGRKTDTLSKLFHMGPVEQAELILARVEYEGLEKEYQEHLRECEQCKTATKAQERLLP